MQSNRITSIDLLRGVVIIIMALDHIRDYFHADAFLFSPTDVTRTSVALFFTRWITHFCAPVFVFLAGTAAFQIGRKKGNGELSSFLLKRGLWLLILEFTVINFAWFFNIRFSFVALTVIWALGIGMILLAGLIYVPRRWLLIISLLAVGGHNLLDHYHPGTVWWKIIHDQAAFQWGPETIFAGYGLIPWVFVMSLGYCFGELYTPDFNPQRRKRILLILGYSSIIAFIIIRLINIYGDPNSWSTQPSPLFALLSFLNTTKYPPSLDYLLMTLGPSMLFLAVSENWQGKFSSAVLVFGRTPMFFYVVHLYVIHVIALVAAIFTGFTASDMVFNSWITDSPNLKGYGFSLGFVHILWVLIVLALYPLCKWYDAYKQGNREKWWLSYL